MRLSAPIFKQKRQAKLMARNENIPLHQALDRIAIAQGFRSWSHLASEAASGFRPAEKILGELCPGDMLLLGARPGHGKTLLGPELAALASQIDRKGLFFTLESLSRSNPSDFSRMLASALDSLDSGYPRGSETACRA